MKKALAFVIALVLLAAMTPLALAVDATVTVSVSVDGQLVVAAQPVTVSDLTVNGVMKAAHAVYYSGGESGYSAGIDPMWNMYMISKAWGITATPYVIVNGVPLGSASLPATVDVAPVQAGDNIIVSISSDPMKPARAIALTADVADGSSTVTATEWVLDFTTFSYRSMPCANAQVIDPATGTVLGTTDAQGTVVVPAVGTAAIDGLAAIPVDGSSASTSAAAPAPAAPAAPTAPAAPAETSEEGVIVYFTVCLDGVLQVAAQPVTVHTLNGDAVLRAGHAKYYSGGEAGYTAAIDPMFNMYLIQRVWGVQTIPTFILNGHPLGTGDNKAYITVDAIPVKEGDNVVIVISTLVGTAPIPNVALTRGDDGTVKATNWTFDPSTYTYSDTPYANADIVDAQSGEVLGTTDALGRAKLKKEPASGVIAVAGLTALAVGSDIQPFTPISNKYTPPARDYSVFGGPDGRQLLLIVIFGVGGAIPLGAIVLHAQRKELKNYGVKFVDPAVGKKK
jgi:hypothetical protein